METMPTFLSSFFYGGKLVSTTLSQPICRGLDLIFLSRTLVLPFSCFSILNCPLFLFYWIIHAQHTQSSYISWPYAFPMLPSYFPYSLSPLLHLLILLQKGLLFLPLPPDAVSKVTKACFPAVHCHGYLLSFSYSIPRQQSKLFVLVEYLFFGGMPFYLFMLVAAPLLTVSSF